MLQPVCTSPDRGGLARGLPKVPAHVRLVAEAAPKRNVTQARIGRQHVLSCQFYATAHEESMRRCPEGAFKGAGEVRVAALNERAEIGDEYPARDMTINVVAHHAHLPG